MLLHGFKLKQQGRTDFVGAMRISELVLQFPGPVAPEAPPLMPGNLFMTSQFSGKMTPTADSDFVTLEIDWADLHLATVSQQQMPDLRAFAASPRLGADDSMSIQIVFNSIDVLPTQFAGVFEIV